MREPKPTLVNQQCVVYNYQCDLCDAEYVGYTSWHLHQRIDEHRSSAIGKHLKNDQNDKKEIIKRKEKKCEEYLSVK